MMNAATFVGLDVHARSMKAYRDRRDGRRGEARALRPRPRRRGRPGPLAAAARRVPPASRIPPTGGPLGGFDPQSGADSPDGRPARGVSALGPRPAARIPPTGGPRGDPGPPLAACGADSPDGWPTRGI